MCVFFFFFFCFLGSHLWHGEVPRRGVQSELQLLAYATAIATPVLSCVCDLHHSSQQHRSLNPLSKARNRTCNLVVPSQIRFCCATTGTPTMCILCLLMEHLNLYAKFSLEILYLIRFHNICCWKSRLTYHVSQTYLKIYQ